MKRGIASAVDIVRVGATGEQNLGAGGLVSENGPVKGGNIIRILGIRIDTPGKDGAEFCGVPRPDGEPEVRNLLGF